MNLAIDYTSFSACELLEYSIKQVRDHVDYINVTYQIYSYFGQRIKSENLEILNDLRSRKLIDNLLLFQTSEIASDSYGAKKLEVNKRNFGKNYLFGKGFTHFINLDEDEIFKPDQFKNAKQYVMDNKIDLSACHYVNYIKSPRFRCRNISSSVIPFINKLDSRPFEGSIFLGKFLDPTRGLTVRSPLEKLHLFNSDDLLMHHFSNVRKDLYHKYSNTSLASLDKSKINSVYFEIDKISEDNLKISDYNNILGIDYEVVENYFNIKI